ncbi:hypothetical protein DFS34DRAFT_652783 [Phlyctochytrium arcticum]|nr:hypothetical protein DFS34DRAFT_652783 [Phlyctochytrium arcticum]
MASLITTMSSIGMTLSIVYAGRIIEHPRLSTKKKIPLLLNSFSHIIQRVTMMFYFVPDISRNCTVLIVIGNVFGLGLFRYSLIYVFVDLGKALLGDTRVSRFLALAINLIFVASFTMLMVNVITAPIKDPATCGQELGKFLTLTNNLLFMGAFTMAVGMVIYVLQSHLRTVDIRADREIARLQRTQLTFTTIFLATWITFTIGQYWVDEWPWLMSCFILCDTIFVNGILLWLMPESDKSHKDVTSFFSPGESKANKSSKDARLLSQTIDQQSRQLTGMDESALRGTINRGEK